MGSRIPLLFGITLMALGYTALTLLDPDIYWQFAIALVLIGAGYGIIIGPLTVLSANNFFW